MFYSSGKIKSITAGSGSGLVLRSGITCPVCAKVTIVADGNIDTIPKDLALQILANSVRWVLWLLYPV